MIQFLAKRIQEVKDDFIAFKNSLQQVLFNYEDRIISLEASNNQLRTTAAKEVHVYTQYIYGEFDSIYSPFDTYTVMVEFFVQPTSDYRWHRYPADEWDYVVESGGLIRLTYNNVSDLFYNGRFQARRIVMMGSN